MEQLASGRPDIGVLLAREAVLQVPEPHHANNAWQALSQAVQEFRLDGAITSPDKPSAIAFSTDGCRMAVGDVRGCVRIWNYRTRRIEHTLAGHSAAIRQCEFGFAGKCLLSNACDDTAQLWDLSTGAPMWQVGGEAGIIVSAFLPNAGFIATGGGRGNISLWNALGERAQVLALGTADITCIAAFDERLLITATSDGTVCAWDVSTVKPFATFVGKKAPVSSLAVFKNGEERLLACGYAGPDGAAYVWKIPMTFPSGGFFRLLFRSSQVPEIHPMITFQFPAPVTSVELGGTRRCLAVATSAGVVEIRLLSGNAVESVFEAEQLTPNRDPDRVQRLYAALGGAALNPPELDEGNIPVAAIERKMQYVAISSRQNGAIRLWNLECKVSADESVSHCDLHGHASALRLLQFSPCGRYLASCADDAARLWFVLPGRD
jgi:WD40 repeat protein